MAIGKQTTRDAELEQAIAEFAGAFEVVFGEDWPYGQELLHHCPEQAIPDDGSTFIRSSKDPDRVNWGSRAALLQAYERLSKVMEERGIKSRRPVRDTWFVYSWPKGPK